MNSNRKVDRLALPAPPASRPALQREYRAPRDPLQDQLVRIWEDLLEVAPIGIDDEFLDLGGDSLLAMRMLAEVERSCGIGSRSPALLESATIERLSQALMAMRGGSTPSVVAVQPAGTRPPLYFLHGDYLTGGLFCLDLARELGADQPLFAITPLGLDGPPHPETLEEMAARHLQALREVQPSGPYHLAGNCNGGLLAFEMARQLLAAGEQVPTLAVVRASAANIRHEWIARAVQRLGAITRLGAMTRHRLLVHGCWYADALRRSSLPAAVALTLQKILKLLSAMTGHRAMGQDTQSTTPEEESIEIRYMRLTTEYVPQFYPGKVTVFWPAEDNEPAELAARAWQRTAQHVDFQVVPGNHLNYVTRHVVEFAQRLRASMQTDGRVNR